MTTPDAQQAIDEQAAIQLRMRLANKLLPVIAECYQLEQPGY